MTAQITLNHEQGLYVIPSHGGYSCLGFEVTERRRKGYLAWLNKPYVAMPIGSLEAYSAYHDALKAVLALTLSTGLKCDAELTPALLGLEGKRVEVVTPSGERSRFWVGKSAGPIPIHLEVKTKRSRGGGGAYVPEGSTVRVIR